MTLPPPPDRWTIELANAERAGGDCRVRLHRTSGAVPAATSSCTPASSSSASTARFAGIVHGQKSTDFIRTLVERRFATAITTGKLHRGRMFHVHYKPLWAAIGEPDSRFRKPTAPGRMIERVMLLDAVLDDRELSPGWGPRWTSGVTLSGISRTASISASIHI